MYPYCSLAILRRPQTPNLALDPRKARNGSGRDKCSLKTLKKKKKRKLGRKLHYEKPLWLTQIIGYTVSLEYMISSTLHLKRNLK